MGIKKTKNPKKIVAHRRAKHVVRNPPSPYVPSNNKLQIGTRIPSHHYDYEHIPQGMRGYWPSNQIKSKLGASAQQPIKPFPVGKKLSGPEWAAQKTSFNLTPGQGKYPPGFKAQNFQKISRQTYQVTGHQLFTNKSTILGQYTTLEGFASPIKEEIGSKTLNVALLKPDLGSGIDPVAAIGQITIFSLLLAGLKKLVQFALKPFLFILDLLFKTINPIFEEFLYPLIPLVERIAKIILPFLSIGAVVAVATLGASFETLGTRLNNMTIIFQIMQSQIDAKYKETSPLNEFVRITAPTTNPSSPTFLEERDTNWETFIFEHFGHPLLPRIG